MVSFCLKTVLKLTALDNFQFQVHIGIRLSEIHVFPLPESLLIALEYQQLLLGQNVIFVSLWYVDQVRYLKWIWWTRFASVITILQFVGATYLLVHLYKSASHQETANECLLGKSSSCATISFFQISWYFSLLLRKNNSSSPRFDLENNLFNHSSVLPMILCWWLLPQRGVNSSFGNIAMLLIMSSVVSLYFIRLSLLIAWSECQVCSWNEFWKNTCI